MASPLDQTEFVDTDVNPPARPPATGDSPFAASRAPTREELDDRATDVQSKLVELHREQEQLERERRGLEEARRRRAEFQTGREEMLHHLGRGVGLLEEAERKSRRDAEQMAKTLDGMREALLRVEAINEEAWSEADWNMELTRALTCVENARNEWNAALLKWELLDGVQKVPVARETGGGNGPALIGDLPFGQLCRVGFALTWPVALAALAILLVLLFR